VCSKSIEMIEECHSYHNQKLESIWVETDSALRRIGEASFAEMKGKGEIVFPWPIHCETALRLPIAWNNNIRSQLGNGGDRRIRVCDDRIDNHCHSNSVEVMGNFAFLSCCSLDSVTFQVRSNLRIVRCNAFIHYPSAGSMKIAQPLRKLCGYIRISRVWMTFDISLGKPDPTVIILILVCSHGCIRPICFLKSGLSWFTTEIKLTDSHWLLYWLMSR
jgi:hypothetical protein